MKRSKMKVFFTAISQAMKENKKYSAIFIIFICFCLLSLFVILSQLIK